jgi:hypothetical protein
LKVGNLIDISLQTHNFELNLNPDSVALLVSPPPHHQGDEAVSTFEMSVNLYKITQRNIPEDSHLHTH